MIYRGYEINMCREQCEVWSLDNDGEPVQCEQDCPKHPERLVTYYLRNTGTGEILGSGWSLDAVKKYADALALGLPA